MACQWAFTLRSAPSCSASRTSAASNFQQRSRGLWQPSRQLKFVRVQAVLAAEATDLDVSKMAPLGDRLLVKPKEQEQVTSGGILLAGSSKPNMQDAIIGTVVAVGEDVDCGVAAGDTILYSKYSTSDVEVPGGEVTFVGQRSVLAKLS